MWLNLWWWEEDPRCHLAQIQCTYVQVCSIPGRRAYTWSLGSTRKVCTYGQVSNHPGRQTFVQRTSLFMLHGWIIVYENWIFPHCSCAEYWLKTIWTTNSMTWLMDTKWFYLNCCININRKCNATWLITCHFADVITSRTNLFISWDLVSLMNGGVIW